MKMLVQVVSSRLLILTKMIMFLFFYSGTCNTVPFEAVSFITRKNAKYKSICVKNGTKDALDFQLSSVLGYMISIKKNAAKYYIVSNDKGFDCLCTFWSKSKFEVRRLATNKEIELAEKADNKPKTNRVTIDEIMYYIPEKDLPDQVCFICNKSKSKQNIHIGLSRLYRDSRRTTAVYNKLKPLLVEKGKK